MADPGLAARLRALADCPDGSLGRAFIDFYARWDLTFPGEPGGGDASLVPHDFTHVLSGYDADAPGELALQAMLTSSTGFEEHFSGLVASLSLYEAGKFDILQITPTVGALDAPGAAAELADALRRGAQCTCDFEAIDHLARQRSDRCRARRLRHHSSQRLTGCAPWSSCTTAATRSGSLGDRRARSSPVAVCTTRSRPGCTSRAIPIR